MAISKNHPEHSLIAAGRGFTGLLAGLILLLLLLANVIRLRLPFFIQVPSYVLGTLLLYGGLRTLNKAEGMRPAWSRLIRQGYLAVFIQLYLSPFYAWWTQAPYSSYFFSHLVLLIFSMLSMLYITNRLVHELARRMADAELMVESTLSGWAVMAFGFIPLGTLFLLATLLAVIHQTTIPFEFKFILQEQIPVWVQALVYLPMTFTMVLCWKAAGRAFRGVGNRRAPQAPSAASSAAN